MLGVALIQQVAQLLGLEGVVHLEDAFQLRQTGLGRGLAVEEGEMPQEVPAHLFAQLQGRAGVVGPLVIEDLVGNALVIGWFGHAATGSLAMYVSRLHFYAMQPARQGRRVVGGPYG